ARVPERAADGSERMGRSVVERRQVDAERVDGQHVKAAEAVERDPRETEWSEHGQAEGEPWAPAPAPDVHLLTGEGDRHRVARPIDAEAQMQREGWSPLPTRIGRPGNVGRTLIAGERQGHEPTAPRIAPPGVGSEVRGEVEEGAVGAEQIGDAEAREHPATRHGIRGKGVRDVQDVDPYPVLGGQLPEGYALTGREALRARAPDEPRPVPRRPHASGADVRKHLARVALDEVEDAVARRRGASGEGGPRDRRLWRVGGGERPEVPALRELTNPRQLPLAHPLGEKPRVHAVEAQDDEPRSRRALRLPSAPQR